MADLAVTDVVATQVGKTEIGHVSKRAIFDLVFGNGTLTYPTGGIPLSTAMLGMKRELNALCLSDASNGDGFVYKWDHTNNKIRIYTQGVTVGAAGAVTLDDFPVTAAVGTDAAISVSLTNSAGAGTHRFGALKELVGGTDAPAATTLRVVAYGW